jgi:hypothetical protein
VGLEVAQGSNGRIGDGSQMLFVICISICHVSFFLPFIIIAFIIIATATVYSIQFITTIISDLIISEKILTLFDYKF